MRFWMIALVLGFFPVASLHALSKDELDKKISAQGVLLVDVATGEVIYEKNADGLYPPASTVKLMTALLVYEKTGMEGNIRVAKEDTQVEPSHVPLRAGERVSISDMVYTLLIGSDNDSAMVLARAAGGSQSKFYEMMNQKAEELGCTQTTYTNPHGLPDPDQFTTAHDLMKVFDAVLAIPQLRKIMTLTSFNLRTRIGSQKVRNHNKLLGHGRYRKYKYEGMGPAKTGWTIASKHTYAASATRDGRELRLTLLKSKNKWDDAPLIFNYGFDHLPEYDPEKEAEAKMAAAQPPSDFERYVIKKGDTLYSLSKRYECSVEDLMEWNGLKNPRNLSVGKILQVPALKKNP